jgi:hypothetical protein
MSIGPSLQTRERTPTTERERTTSQSFALQYAKRSFEPYNTNPTPEMFADKWVASD